MHGETVKLVVVHCVNLGKIYISNTLKQVVYMIATVFQIVNETFPNIIYLHSFNINGDTIRDFYDRVTEHRNRFLVNKTNRCTEFQFYWYYYSTSYSW